MTLPTPPDAKLVKVRTCDETKEDIILCYETFGDPKNPCLLLICGLGMQLLDYDDDLVADFVAKGFYCVRFDNRDVGFSTKIERPEPKLWKFLLPACCCCCCPEVAPYSLDAMAADAVALLDALGVAKAHILGSSMGGMIAQLVALNFPSRVLSLTIVFSMSGNRNVQDPPFWVQLWLVKKPKSKQRDDLFQFHVDLERAIVANGEDCPTDAERLPRVEGFFRRQVYVDGKPRQAAAIVTAPPRDARLKKMQIPTLVFHGASDVLVPPKNGEHLAKLIPNAKLVLVPRMSHYIGPIQRPLLVDEVAQLAARAASTPPSNEPIH